MLNLIKVRYCENTTIEDSEYYVRLNNANKQYDNPINTFKVMLYLVSLLTENGLKENTYIITCDEIHTKLSIGNINSFKIITKLVKKYNLPKLTFHELRHTSASVMVENEINLKAVSQRLGHSNTNITDIYTHTFDEQRLSVLMFLMKLLKIIEFCEFWHHFSALVKKI